MIFTDRLIDRAGRERIPLIGNFELSPLCNFSCSMCYVRRGSAEVRAMGGLQSAETWLSLAKAARDAGTLWLTLTGGEPFLFPNFLELYEALSALGLVLSINSNGALIDERAMAVLRRCRPKRINLTLYGASPKTYEAVTGDPEGYHRVMDTVARLRRDGIRFRFNCSLTKQNARELPQMVALAKANNAVIEVASYMFPPRRCGKSERSADCLSPQEAGERAANAMLLRLPEDAFERYAASMQRVAPPPEEHGEGLEMACRAGRCSYWVNWQGEITPCGMMDIPKRDLKNQPFAPAWADIVEEVNALRCLNGCSACPNRRLCKPCAAGVLCETGTFQGRPEYKCKMLLAEAAACNTIMKERSK